jgi:hypothetical protein
VVLGRRRSPLHFHVLYDDGEVRSCDLDSLARLEPPHGEETPCGRAEIARLTTTTRAASLGYFRHRGELGEAWPWTLRLETGFLVSEQNDTWYLPLPDRPLWARSDADRNLPALAGLALLFPFAILADTVLVLGASAALAFCPWLWRS